MKSLTSAVAAVARLARRWVPTVAIMAGLCFGTYFAGASAAEAALMEEPMQEPPDNIREVRYAPEAGGGICSRVTTKVGIPHGAFEEWWPSGILKWSGGYRRGYKDGAWTKFSIGGTRQRVEHWRNGKLIKTEVEGE